MNNPESPRDEIVRSKPLLISLMVSSALLITLSGPPFGWWPLALVALLPLFPVLHGRVAIRAAGVGWLSGLLTSFLALFWLPSTLQGFSELSPAAAIGFTSVLSGYQAGRWALLGWLYVRLTRSGWPIAAAALFASVTAEVVYPLPFPWYFGSALHEVPVLLQVVELGGPTAASTIVISFSAAVFGALRVRSKDVPMRRRFLDRKDRYALLAVGATAPLAFFYGSVRMRQVDSGVARAPSLTVGIVQADLPPTGTNLRKALELQLALSRDLVGTAPVDLLLWSETALPGAPPQFAARQHFERLVTRRTGVPTLFGTAVDLSSPAAAGPQLNSAFLSDERGSICERCRYDKQILLPFGEALPGERWWPGLRQTFPRSGRFVPGPRRHGLELDRRPIAVNICYEELHSGYVRRQVSEGAAQLLVNLTDDAWFAAPEVSQWHFTLAKLRAVEQRRFLVRATNSGVSAVVDPVGRVVARAPLGTGSMLQDVRWLEARTFYSYVGNSPWWFVAVITIARAMVPTRWLRRVRWRARRSI